MKINTGRKLSLMLTALLCALPLCACGTSGERLTPPTLDPNKPIETDDFPYEYDPQFEKAVRNFSNKLFKDCSISEPGDNTLVSPLSVYIALAMVSNGAVGNTQSEITEALSGRFKSSSVSSDNTEYESLSIERINQQTMTLIKGINYEGTMKLANSVFVLDRDDVHIVPDFINVTEKSYKAEIFHEVYSDKTFDTINKWVDKNTNNMIPNMLEPDAIDPNTIAVLLNALAFEGEWKEAYDGNDVLAQEFHNYDGTTVTTDFLHGTESTYYRDEYCTGFRKLYKLDKAIQYSFIAVLPNEEMGIDEFISEKMTDDTIKTIAENAHGKVKTAIPKFTFDKDYKLPDILKNMGIQTAFDPNAADFSDLAFTDDGYVISISDIIHKTHIELDEKGTKAAAATAIIMEKNDAVEMVETVTLDRPFVFAIYDDINEIPVFMGKVCVLE